MTSLKIRRRKSLKYTEAHRDPRGAGRARPARPPKAHPPAAIGRAAAGSGTRAPVLTRRATTVRLDPVLHNGLALLQQVLKKPLNRLVNEAVRRYVERRSAEVEIDLKEILDRVRAYRRSDLDFDAMWDAFIDAEVRYGAKDPVEGGKQKNAGPAQAMVRELLRA